MKPATKIPLTIARRTLPRTRSGSADFGALYVTALASCDRRARKGLVDGGTSKSAPLCGQNGLGTDTGESERGKKSSAYEESLRTFN